MVIDYVIQRKWDWNKKKIILRHFTDVELPKKFCGDVLKDNLGLETIQTDAFWRKLRLAERTISVIVWDQWNKNTVFYDPYNGW